VSKTSELVGDLDAALERFAKAGSMVELRRALSEVLNLLYILRAHRERTMPGGKSAYWAAAANDPDGRTIEGIAVVRGVRTHDITREVGPDLQGGVFDPAIFDMRIFDCGTLTWLRDAEMAHPLSQLPNHDAARVANYEADVAGRSVHETVLAARRFLVTSAALPPLT